MNSKHIITDETMSGDVREMYLTTIESQELNPNIAYEIFKRYDIVEFKKHYFYYVGSPVVYMGNGNWSTTKGNSVDWKPISYDENIFTKLKNHNWDYTIWQIENGYIESAEFFNEYLVWLDDEKAKYEQIAKENAERDRLAEIEADKRKIEILEQYNAIQYKRRNKREFQISSENQGKMTVEGWLIELTYPEFGIELTPVMGIHKIGKKYRVTHLATGYFLKDLDTLKLATTLAVWFGDFLFDVETIDDVPEGLSNRLEDWDNVIRWRV